MERPEFSQLAREIGALLDRAHIRPPDGREKRAARIIVEPADVDEIVELVRKCESDRLTIAALGSARTLAEIRRQPADIGVSLARMNRLIAYEPHDMTFTAEAGLTLGGLNSESSRHGQRLPADPARPELTTLGSLVAGAKAGPLHLSEGTVRDLLIGIRFVGHGGSTVHGGGRVVKNVAGYDLMKVMTGSFGTLGIITETTFKVRPAPQNYSLAIAAFDDVTTAFDAARLADETLQLIHLEVLTPGAAARLGRPAKFIMLAGFGGSAKEAEYQRMRIDQALATRVEILTEQSASETYRQLRDFDLSASALAARLSVLPTELARSLEDGGDSDFVAQPLTGVADVYLAAESDAVETIARWRAVAHRGRGNLRVIRARPELRERLGMFDDPPQPALALMRKLKTAFDPYRVFNPGCFVGGI